MCFKRFWFLCSLKNKIQIIILIHKNIYVNYNNKILLQCIQVPFFYIYVLVFSITI